MPYVRQTNFSAGEISPLLWGRTDLAKFGFGLRRCRNFFPSRHGACFSRPGTKFVTLTKNAENVRLVPFVYSDTQSYVLEFGHLYVRFHSYGTTVLRANPLLDFDGKTEKFWQGQTVEGDLSGARGVVAGITDNGATGTLELADVTGVFLDNEHIAGTLPHPTVRLLNFTAQGSNFTLGQAILGGSSGATAVLVAQTDNGSTGQLELTDIFGAFVNGETLTDFLGGSATCNGVLHYKYGQAYANGTLHTVELELVTPYTIDEVDELRWAQSGDVLVLTHPNHPPQELKRFSHASWTLGEVSFFAESPRFVDLPDRNVSTLGPKVVEPLPVADSTHPAKEWIYKVTVLAQDPETGVTFETQPMTVTDSFNGTSPTASSGTTLPQLLAVYPDRAIKFRRPELTGGGLPFPAYNPIAYNFYKGQGDVFGFIGQTKDRDFVDNGIEPDYSIQPPMGQNPFRIQNPDGTDLRIEHPSAITYFQERRVYGGTTERPGFLFASATGDYSNMDVHLVQIASEALVFELAARKREDIRHLLGLSRLLAFTSSSVWSISGQQGNPLQFDSVDARVEAEIGCTSLPPLVVDGSALFVRNKGVGVRSLQFDVGRDGFASTDISELAQHLFIGESRIVTPAGTLLNRPTSRSLVDWTYAEDPWGLVWAARDDGVLLSLTYSAGEGNWAWARHDTDGLVKRVCSVPEGDEDAVYVLVQRTINTPPSLLHGTINRFYIERMTSRVRRGGPDDDICVDSALRYQGPVTQTFSGLNHLEGKQVWALSYGNPPVGPLTVENGSVVLPAEPSTTFVDSNGVPVLVMHIGLPFTPELETLDVASTDARMRQKTVIRVGLEVDQAKGLYAGPDFEHLTEWRQRDVADSYGTISAASYLVTVDVQDGWNQAARAAIRQALPLPVTVLGVTRELGLGE